jgi:hypothetical protein
VPSGRSREAQGLEVNGAHHFLVYAYDNLFGEILSVIMKITESLLGARKEVGVEVNVDKLSMCSCLITMLQTG